MKLDVQTYLAGNMNFPTKLHTMERHKVWGQWESHPEIRVLIQKGFIVAAIDDTPKSSLVWASRGRRKAGRS